MALLGKEYFDHPQGGPQMSGREIILDYLGETPERSGSPFGAFQDKPYAEHPVVKAMQEGPVFGKGKPLGDNPFGPGELAWVPKTPQEMGKYVMMMQQMYRNNPMLNIFSNAEATKTNRIGKAFLETYLSDLRPPSIPMYEAPTSRFRPGVQATFNRPGDLKDKFEYGFSPEKMEEILKRYPEPMVVTRDLQNPNQIVHSVINLGHEGEHGAQFLEGRYPLGPLPRISYDEYWNHPLEVGARAAEERAKKAYLDTLKLFRKEYKEPYVDIQKKLYDLFPD